MRQTLIALRDLAIILVASVLVVYTVVFITDKRVTDAALPAEEGRTLPNPFASNHYEIPDFNVFKNEEDVWRVAVTVLPPSMPIKLYLVVLDDGLKDKLKLKDSSYVARRVPGVGWESPVREVLMKDFSNTLRGYAATIEIHGSNNRYGVIFDLEFTDGRDKNGTFAIPEGTFAVVAEKSGEMLEKTDSQ